MENEENLIGNSFFGELEKIASALESASSGVEEEWECPNCKTLTKTASDNQAVPVCTKCKCQMVEKE